MNPLLEMLLTVKTISTYGSCTASTLETMAKISPATLKRYIKDAREMGADIVSIRKATVPAYECRNWSDIKKRVELWIELETQRSFIALSPSKFGHETL